MIQPSKKAFWYARSFLRTALAQGIHAATWKGEEGLYFRLSGTFYRWNRNCVFEFSAHDESALLKSWKENFPAGDKEALENIAWDFSEKAARMAAFKREAESLGMELDRVAGQWKVKICERKGDGEPGEIIRGTEPGELWLVADAGKAVAVVIYPPFNGKEPYMPLGCLYFMEYGEDGLKETFSKIMADEKGRAWIEGHKAFHELPEWLRTGMVECGLN